MVERTGSDEWISITEATQIMGCSKSWVLLLLQRGALAGQKIHSRAWVVSKRAAEADASRYREDAAAGKVGRPRAQQQTPPKKAGCGRRNTRHVDLGSRATDMKIAYDDAGVIPASDLIGIKTAAELTGIHRSWLHALISRGDVQVVEIDGKPFVRRSQVEKMPRNKPGRPRKTSAISAKKR
jgi:hypothetical protein